MNVGGAPSFPLPPGVVPSQSRADMAELMGTNTHDRQGVLREGVLTVKKHALPTSEVQEQDVPMEKLSDVWQFPQEPKTEGHQVAEYHVDLGTELDIGSESTTRIKLVKAKETSYECEKKNLLELFSESPCSKVSSGQLQSTKQHPSNLMSPLKRYNKVAPCPPKQHSQTPRKKGKGQMMHKAVSLQSSNENLLLEEKENGSEQEPYQTDRTPFYEDQRPKEKTSSPSKLVSARIEEVHVHATDADEHVYSKVMKLKSSATTPSTSSIESLSSSDSDSDPLYSKVHKPKFVPQRQDQMNKLSDEVHQQNIPSGVTCANEMVQIMADSASHGVHVDSLYDSLREEPGSPSAAHIYETAGASNYSSQIYKHLKKHEDVGNIHLLSIKGSSKFSIGNSPDMLPIHYASASGNKKDLETILSELPVIQDAVELVLGTNKLCRREGVDVTDGELRTALMHAVHNENLGCAKMLVEAGASVNAEALDQSTCLHLAAYSGNLEMVALLLSVGADGMKRDLNGRLALHWATNSSESSCVDLILDKVPGLEVDAADGAGMTALMWAAFYGRLKHVARLKELGANTAHADIDGLRAVHWAVHRHDIRTLQALVSQESSQYRDCNGKTVMHAAAEQGCVRAVELIKSVRPHSVNDIDNNGRTPLHWATVCEHPEVIRALLSEGADPNISDKTGHTAIDYARKRSQHYCTLLLSHGQQDFPDGRTSTPYHHVLSLGESTGIGVRTLMQQEGRVLSMAAASKDLSPEHILQLKAVHSGSWVKKFTNDGRGPLHTRFFWVDPASAKIFWSKSLEARYITNKETKSDILVGVRSSASPAILRRRDFDPIQKHKFAFTIFTSTRVLDMVAVSSEEFKTWLSGLQLLLYMGNEAASKVIYGEEQQNQ